MKRANEVSGDRRGLSAPSRSRFGAGSGVDLLLIEPVFGDGYLDLRRIVSMLPRTRFTVEQMTHNPLKVPVDREDRIRLEEDNVLKCLKFAASELGMRRG